MASARLVASAASPLHVGGGVEQHAAHHNRQRVARAQLEQEPLAMPDQEDVGAAVSQIDAYRSKASKPRNLDRSVANNVERSVAKMRPGKPLVLDSSLRSSSIALCCLKHRAITSLTPVPPRSVYDLVKAMAAKRTDVALLVQGESLAAIVTDHDITRKVIALGLAPKWTEAITVGTTSPQCVEASDSALDALTLMAEHKFRHAPVLDGGMIVGVLNIARCL